MKNTFILGLAVCAGVANAQLFSNGPIVTHAGQGAGGKDVSMASLVPNTGGSNTTATVWRADDFSVTGSDWLVSSIDMFAYDTANPTPRWTAGTMQIRSGSVTGTVVASAAITTSSTNINRVFNGAANLLNADRQLNRVNGNFGGVTLSAGTYFAVLTLTMPAGVNAWVPYVMDPNAANPNDPITRIGNSLVSVDSGVTWTPGNVTTGAWNQAPEIPFLVNGSVVPEPASMAALALGAVALIRRRKK